jgi:hypothetical protein
MVSLAYVRSAHTNCNGEKTMVFFAVLYSESHIECKPGPPFQVLVSDVQPFQQVPKGAYPASRPHNQNSKH